MVAPVVECAISFKTNRVSVFFNEPMRSLGFASNFSIAGLVVTAAAANGDRTRVDLTTTGMVQGSSYTAVCITPTVPSGTITAIAASSITDGEIFTIGDGVVSVVFEFNKDGGGFTPGRTPVQILSGDTANQVGAAIVAAINGHATLLVSGSGGSPVVTVTHDYAGDEGNVAITEAVGNAGFTVTGLAGGTGVTDDGGEALGVSSAPFDGGEAPGGREEITEDDTASASVTDNSIAFTQSVFGSFNVAIRRDPILFDMRARHVSAGLVSWTVSDHPDMTGAESDYDPGDLSDIVIMARRCGESDL